MNATTNDWLTTGEAAGILGVTTPTIIRWIRQGRGPRIFRMPSGYNRIMRADFEQRMNDMEKRPNSTKMVTGAEYAERD